MSLSRSGGHAEAFDDLEQYSRSSDYIVRAAALSGGQQGHNPPNPPAIEPAGGLHRGEVAELVGVLVEDSNIDLKEESGAGTTPGTMIGENELKTSAPMRSENIDKDGSDDVDLRGNDYDDNALLARWYSHGHAAFNDTTNGTGGGGALDSIEGKFYNYREMFGQGPVLKEDHEVYERAYITTNDLSNQDVRFSNYFRTFWDIGEEGDFGVYQ